MSCCQIVLSERPVRLVTYMHHLPSLPVQQHHRLLILTLSPVSHPHEDEAPGSKFDSPPAPERSVDEGENGVCRGWMEVVSGLACVRGRFAFERDLLADDAEDTKRLCTATSDADSASIDTLTLS